MLGPFSLEGRRVLIAGASGGIGSSAARLCAQLGGEPLLLDRTAPTKVQEALAAEGLSSSAIAADVASRRSVELAVSELGRIDALIVCAGISPFDDWTQNNWDEEFDRVMAVNVRGTINCVRSVLPSMMQRQSGRIVLVGSIAAQMGGMLSSPHYIASKGGVHALVKGFARMAAPCQVTVNGVAPGLVDTSMIAGKTVDVSRIPLCRLAKPEEVAAPLLFLASDAASYLCGAVLSVNGGLYLG